MGNPDSGQINMDAYYKDAFDALLVNGAVPYLDEVSWHQKDKGGYCGATVPAANSFLLCTGMRLPPGHQYHAGAAIQKCDNHVLVGCGVLHQIPQRWRCVVATESLLQCWPRYCHQGQGSKTWMYLAWVEVVMAGIISKHILVPTVVPTSSSCLHAFLRCSSVSRNHQHYVWPWSLGESTVSQALHWLQEVPFPGIGVIFEEQRQWRWWQFQDAWLQTDLWRAGKPERKRRGPDSGGIVVVSPFLFSFSFY